VTEDYAIEGRAVTKSRGSFRLGPIDLSLPRGQVLGLVGPNGSGKTTLIKSILGMVRLDSGSLRVAGGTPDGTPGTVCAVLDAKYLVPGWSVNQALAAVSAFYPDWDRGYEDHLVRKFAINRTTKIRSLSSGETKKLALVLALAPRPELAVLDEPTSGIDPLAREEIVGVLREYLAEREGSSILLSTHIPADLVGIADQILAIRGGQVAFVGDMDTLTEEFFAVRGTNEHLAVVEHTLIGVRSTRTNFEAVVRASDSGGFPREVVIEPASVDDIVKALAVSTHEGSI